MTKEWKCTDCVKYKTDACSTCACGYTPTVSCRDVLVDFDYAYHQGRADADKFLKQWKDDVMNSLCKYDANSVEEVYQLGINRGRAEAIEEILSLKRLNHYDMYNELMYQSIKVCDVEQLKEKAE